MSHSISVLQIPNLLTKDQCQEIMTLMDKDSRINEPVKTTNSFYARIYLHLPDLAADLWQKIQDKVKKHFKQYQTPKLSESVRPSKALECIRPVWSATKYESGGHLGVHMDGQSRSRGLVSHLTLILYLNEDFTGGATNFYADEEGATLVGQVIPETGMAMILPQDVFHSGEPIKKGTKYILRTDISEFCSDFPLFS